MSKLGFMAAFFLILPTNPLTAADWEFVKEKKGVQVYKKEIAGSPLVGFKGAMLMQAPITKVAEILLNDDIESKRLWIDMIQEFRFLENGHRHAVSYSSYDLPWPLADRDYVVQSDLAVDWQANELRLTLKSVEHPNAPKSVGVRAELTESQYVLQPRGDDKTFVTVEIVTDPKGMLPAWLVNIIQSDWPSNTLSQLEIQAKKPETIHHPDVLNEFVKKRQQAKLEVH